jgi:DNA polymerase-3 subunit gamma/tau
MLGTVERAQVGEILHALRDGDGSKLLAEVEEMARYSPDFGHVLEDLASELHRIQLHQLVPGFESEESRIDAAAFAGQLTPELVQLWYQMAVNGRRDLGFAPSPRAGFEMALLRMLAFRPAGAASGETAKPAAQRATSAPAQTNTRTATASAPPAATATTITPARPTLILERAEDWLALVSGAGLKGPVLQLGSHSAFCSLQDGVLRLFLPEADVHLRSDNLVRQLGDAVSNALGHPVKIQFENKLSVAGDTLHLRNERQRSERQLAAEASFLADPIVGQLLGQGGNIVPDSIRPLSEN